MMMRTIRGNRFDVKRYMRLMSFSSSSSSSQHFDLLVVGGGSGGISSARRAASHGAKVAVIERNTQLGGTCVNVGCVPKKVMFNAAMTAEFAHDASNFGFEDIPKKPKFNWGTLKERRDAYVHRLNGIYERNLENSGVERILGDASFLSSRKVQVNGVEYTADHVLIATGGYPTIPDCPGASYGVTSDGFFDIENLPERSLVVGAGYIAVELAGILNALGSETTLVVRKEGVLRQFDEMVPMAVEEAMIRCGVNFVRHTDGIASVKRDENTGRLRVEPSDRVRSTPGLSDQEFDQVVWAIGRNPAVDTLNLEAAGVNQDARTNHILVNEFAETSAENTYAIGDVCGKWELTPVAIQTGRILADRLFGGESGGGPRKKMSYEDIPTVVFSHPPVGTVGLTEAQAIEKYGKSEIKTYNSTFVNLYYGTFTDMEPSEKPKTRMKMICQGEDERVVGLHVVGMAADEMLQGFGVAVKMGATKAHFDDCVALHPTAAEEFVTMAPWGMSKRVY